MRMQEVITRLRELAPAAARNVSLAEKLVCELAAVMEDMKNAVTPAACKAIAAEAFRQCKAARDAIEAASDATARLQQCNAAYKERLGPRAKKPADDPRQMVLPFDGTEGGDAGQA